MNPTVHALATLQDALNDLQQGAKAGITIYAGDVPPAVQRELLDQTRRLARALDDVSSGPLTANPQDLIAFLNGPAGPLYAQAVLTLGGMLLGRRVAHLEETKTPYTTVVEEILALCTPHSS